VSERIATVTLDRPDVRNAIDARMQDELHGALSRLRSDPNVGILVLTGCGDRAFAAGADIAQLREHGPLDGLEGRLQALVDRVEEFEKPTIAAVNGYALGGGCELAMACDIRIAAEGARFGLPELNLSVLPGAGGTQRLVRLAGAGRALEMILTGRMVAAEEARAAGLVTTVVPAEELLATARDIAAGVLAKGPVAVRLARQVVRAAADVDLRTGLAIERLAQSVLYSLGDKEEGIDAFLEKRAPAFEGR
jgi:enoyl-CoA hydratase/carnithine racemase